MKATNSGGAQAYFLVRQVKIFLKKFIITIVLQFKDTKDIKKARRETITDKKTKIISYNIKTQ